MTAKDSVLSNQATITNMGLGVLLTVHAFTGPTSLNPVKKEEQVNISDQIRPWEQRKEITTTSSGFIDKQPDPDSLINFANEIINQTIDPNPEFDAVIAEHFWELI